MSIENGYINFKFAISYEHEYDEIHSRTMEFAIIYSFKQDTLPSVIPGPEIAAVIAGSAAIDSTISALIAVVFNGIRPIL